MNDTTTETMTYMGRRAIQGGKIAYVYRKGHDEPVYYGKPFTGAGTAVGSLVKITRPFDSPEEFYSRGSRAPIVCGYDDSVDPDVLLSWQVADRAAYQVKADTDATKRAAKRADELTHHIEALRAAVSGVTSYERAAFARWVADQIRGY